jgi:hypothetical protein
MLSLLLRLRPTSVLYLICYGKRKVILASWGGSLPFRVFNFLIVLPQLGSCISKVLASLPLV